MSPAEETGIAGEKVAYIRSALRSTTFAYLLSPNLCIPLFLGDVAPVLLWTWYGLAMGLGAVRILISFGPVRERAPDKELQILTLAVGGIGLVWGAGWILLVPELNTENRYIFLYIITGTMFSAMFGYGVHKPAFYAVAMPTLAPVPLALFWPDSGFPLPFSIGILGLMVTVIGISRRFESTFVETLRLRFENETIVKQLARERDLSVAANIAKSEFIATASHDLRQPLYAINLNLKALDRKIVDEQPKETLKNVEKSVTQLNAMFNSLLDLSRADAGVIVPHIQVIDLSQTLSDVCATIAVQCAARGLNFMVDLGDTAIRSDPLLLAQIVQNLLANAVQNTAKGSVALSAQRHGDAVEIAIVDTGRGIPESEREKIFDEFYRVPDRQAEAQDRPGLGLGLSIVRRLGKVLGIKLTLESEEGQGSIFRFSVPAAEAIESVAEPTGMAPQHRLSGRTILVIDDDPHVRAAFAAAFESDGVYVIQSDGQDLARGICPAQRPDAIIADYKLGPDWTGDRAIMNLRAHYGHTIPAIIMTADTAPDRLTAFAAIGVPVLFKPVGYAALHDALTQEIERAATA